MDVKFPRAEFSNPVLFVFLLIAHAQQALVMKWLLNVIYATSTKRTCTGQWQHITGISHHLQQYEEYNIFNYSKSSNNLRAVL